jgi:hypothetical protein
MRRGEKRSQDGCAQRRGVQTRPGCSQPRVSGEGHVSDERERSCRSPGAILGNGVCVLSVVSEPVGTVARIRRPYPYSSVGYRLTQETGTNGRHKRTGLVGVTGHRSHHRPKGETRSLDRSYPSTEALRIIACWRRPVYEDCIGGLGVSGDLGDTRGADICRIMGARCRRVLSRPEGLSRSG